jgi:hypothetical protein
MATPPVLGEELDSVVADDLDPPAWVVVPPEAVLGLGAELSCPLSELPHAGTSIPRLMAYRSDARSRLLPR